MSKTSNTKNDYLSGVLLFTTILMSTGWYFAECENELLRKEAALASYTKPVKQIAEQE